MREKMDEQKMYHIMFLPVVSGLDHDFVLNVLTMIVFLGLYLWHTSHDHAHNKELLSEVKKIREELKQKKATLE